MTHRIDRCIARFHDLDGAVVGAGFLLPNGYVMTCAHVVNAALQRDLLDRSEPARDAPVSIDFPLLAGQSATRGGVVGWRWPGLDAAVLQLDPSPTDAVRLDLRVLTEPRNVAFRAFGFPSGFAAERRNERGLVVGAVVGGNLEIRPTDGHDYFVEQGFSGAPALDESNRVVGMVLATGPDPEKGLAYLIPAQQLERAWPPLVRPYRGLEAFDQGTGR